MAVINMIEAISGPAATHTPVDPIPTVKPGPTVVVQDIHDVGKRTLWVVTVLMALSSVVFYILAGRSPLPKRVFHTLIALTTTISFLIYLALSTGTGVVHAHSLIRHAHSHVPDTTTTVHRQIFWLRYVNWFLTEPLTLLNLSFISGLPGAHLLVAIAADYAMLGAGLFGTFAGHTARRWVWFVISAIAYLVVVYQMGVNASKAASRKDVQTKRFFGAYSAVTLLVKALYPIALASGALALKINLDSESIVFAIYDIIEQGILGYWLLVAHDSSPRITLYVDGFWTNGIGNEGAIRVGDEEGA